MVTFGKKMKFEPFTLGLVINNFIFIRLRTKKYVHLFFFSLVTINIHSFLKKINGNIFFFWMTKKKIKKRKGKHMFHTP